MCIHCTDQRAQIKRQVKTRTYYFIMAVCMDCEVPRRTKTHLSVLILNKRDSAFNGRLHLKA